MRPLKSRLNSLRVSTAAVIAVLLLLSLPAVAVVHAQTEPPVPVPPLPPPIVEAPHFTQVVVEEHSVDAQIEGQVAQVYVTQVLRNVSGSVAEGMYIFPLPEDAAVSDFQMTVDGEVLEGKLYDRDEARRIYEQIVRRQRDPALLEYLDRGLFQTSVFPIPPGESRTVELTYTHLVEHDGELFHFNYPLSMRGFGESPAKHIAVRVELTDIPGLRTIYSPNYPVTIERTADDHAVVTYTADDETAASDLDLYYGAADGLVGLNLLSYKPAGEDGYFLLLAAPSVEAGDEEVVARDIVVVLDVSGSMRGKKMEQATTAVQYIVDSLNPGDRFNLIAFSTGVSLWEDELQPVDADAVEGALDWIAAQRATGSTDLNRALLDALAQLDNGGDAARPAYILFITDGQPTQGETEPDAIVRNALNNLPDGRTPRVFPFGVGYDVNTDLLDTIAAELRGVSQYVTPDQQIDEVVGSFYEKVSTPVLADIELDFGNEMVEDIYPYPLPDLFAGQQLVVAGRYRDGGDVEVALAGRVNGEPRLYVYPELSLADHGGDAFVARLWATRKIGHLLAQIRRDGPDPELVDAITELSLRYGIVTPYTSYLVLEPEMIIQAPGGEVPLPDISMDATQFDRLGAAAAAAAAAAPAAGEAAVAGSQARIQLQQAETVRETAPEVRYIGGRAFMLRAYVTAADGSQLQLWVDSTYDEKAMELTTIVFGSEEYFALLDQPGMAEWLSLSSELILVTGEDSAIRITSMSE